MVGIITWKVSQKTITGVTIEGIEDSYSKPIVKIFKDLQLKPTADLNSFDGTYKAYLHIQDIQDFFLKTIQPPQNSSLLPEKFVFAQNKLLNQQSKSCEGRILPIIHISTTNLIEDHYNGFIHVPRFAAIMESSIWNYYFCFKDYFELAELPKLEAKRNNLLSSLSEPECDATIKNLKDLDWEISRRKEKAPDEKEYSANILQSITINHIRGYYDLAITHEYADLNARLTQQSYICDQNGHGKSISPFIFHSERKMRQRYEGKEFKERINSILAHSWRILLVDDKWEEKLSLARKGGASNTNKFDIIKRQFEEMGFSVVNLNKNKEKSDNKPPLFIDSVPNVEDALEIMRKKKYDIVLLDYLLDLNSQGKPVEYGYEVLTRLKEDLVLRQMGPQKRNFFMFISAFTTAVDERLLAAGLTRSEDYWYISEGACPTNTPEQFKYYIANLMWKRLDDSGIKDLSADAIYTLLNDIFLPKGKDGPQTSVRKRANDNYRRILSLLYHYHRLLGDVGKNDELPFTSGSVLVTEFMIAHPQIGGLLEHLVQLVHITAFGTVRQWPEMWEEYLYCKAQFDDYYGSDSVAEKTKISELYQNIERHILSLHSL